MYAPHIITEIFPPKPTYRSWCEPAPAGGWWWGIKLENQILFDGWAATKEEAIAAVLRIEDEEHV